MCLAQAFSQCIHLQNPSFELIGGIDNDSTPPPHWSSCVHGYAATLPLQGDTLTAYNGYTYLGLRYANFSLDTVNGTVSQRLNIPFAGNGAAYTMTVELSYLPNPNPSWPDNAICQICAGYDSCSINEVLWSSPIIPIGSNNAPAWTKYTFTCHPADADTFLIIRVTTQAPTQQLGAAFYIGVDSISISCNNPASGIEGIPPLELSIYPNPAKNSIVVKSGDNTTFTLKIYDVTGREVIAREIYGTTSTIDISKLSKGVYIVNASREGKVYCSKLVIE